MESILIVYYSRKGENYWNGSIRKLEKGNTQIVAEMIQKAVGGGLSVRGCEAAKSEVLVSAWASRAVGARGEGDAQ